MIQEIKTYGYEFKNIVVNTLLGVPDDTFSVPVELQTIPFFAIKNGDLWRWNTNTFVWEIVTSGGATSWGTISGTLSNQTDLQGELDNKQPLDDDLTTIATIGSALQQIRVNAGGTALEYFTPSSGNTIYTGDGTIADAVRTISLNGNTLNVDSALGTNLSVAQQQTIIAGYDATNGGNSATVAAGTNDVIGTVDIRASFDAVSTQCHIQLSAVSGNAFIDYTAGNHNFTGVTRLIDLAGNGVGVVSIDNNGFLGFSAASSYTDEQAQDAVGGMVDGSLTYVDGTPLLQRSALTGDISAPAGSNTTTLATVNGNVGSFGSATQASIFTVNGKGLITAASQATVTPAVGSITGLGTGVATFLATPSSANLKSAITDETGGGALVFATSPTFNTSILLAGPTSGNVTLAADALSNVAVGTNLSGSGHIPFVQSIIARADETLSNTTNDQNLFTNTGHDVITVQANTTYEFFITGDFTHGAVSHSIALGFTPTTAVVTRIEYNSRSWVTAVGTPTASDVKNRVKTTATTAINLAGANATESFEAQGTITIGNTGGTITPQVKFSADPTGTILLKEGARMKIWPIGNDTFIAQGNIA